MESEERQDAAIAIPEPGKSRAVAALLGVVVPGMGLVFVGHARRGLLWLLVPFVPFVIFVLVAREPSPLSVLAVLGSLLSAAYLGAIVDAVVLPVSKHRATSIPAVAAFAIGPILVAPIVAIGLRVFVLEAFKVPSGAMIPSVLVGDRVFADKAVYRGRAPRRGEIVVFHYPERPQQDFLHRAIAVAGDRLEVRGGHPRINGWDVPSCSLGTFRYAESYDGTPHEGEVFVEYLESSSYLVFFDKNAPQFDYQGPFVAAPGETWVLGDNRFNAHDSRAWFGGQGGGVPRSNVIGRARLIWLSSSGARGMTDLAADPVAPAPELVAPLAACLAKRPPLAATTPPAPH